MLTLILILLAVAVALWLMPSKKGKSGSVVESITSPFSSTPTSLFGQQLDEEADMLANAYRAKAKAAREAEIIEKASTLLSK